MGVITDLDTRIKEVANIVGVSSVQYDRIDSINEDSKNSYPMLIYRVTGETNTTYRNNKAYPVMAVDFFLSDLHYQGDTNTIPQKLDTLRDMIDSLIKSIGKSDNNFELLDSATAEFGWETHNDDLVIVKRTASIKGFTCITKVDQ